MEKSAVTEEWFIWPKCVGYVGAQDDACDLARWVLGHTVNKAKQVTMTYISRQFTIF